MEITNSKAYTDIEQSKILAQIIDKDTADFCWGFDQEKCNDNVFVFNCTPYPLPWKDYTARDFYLPCWSLASLLNLLPPAVYTEIGDILELEIAKTGSGSYLLQYANPYNGLAEITSGFQEHLIDAVYEVVLNLSELKLL